jgi:hypothetical protein
MRRGRCQALAAIGGSLRTTRGDLIRYQPTTQ